MVVFPSLTSSKKQLICRRLLVHTVLGTQRQESLHHNAILTPRVKVALFTIDIDDIVCACCAIFPLCLNGMFWVVSVCLHGCRRVLQRLVRWRTFLYMCFVALLVAWLVGCFVFTCAGVPFLCEHSFGSE